MPQTMKKFMRQYGFPLAGSNSPSFPNDVSVVDDLTVSDNLTVSGAATVAETLGVTGNVTMSTGNLTVSLGTMTAANISGPVVKTVTSSITSATAAAGAGGLISLVNPEGVALIILSAALRLTAGDAAQTADIGVAANGTTSSDTLFDGTSIATAALIGSTTVPLLWGATSYVTGPASGTPDTVAGKVFITYVLA